MRQKAINLDQAKMRSLFPSLADAQNADKFPVAVHWCFGDGSSIDVTQNVSLSEKNWRLNSMPWVDIDVDPGAIVVCQILGDDAPDTVRRPTGVVLALITEQDQGFAWLDERLPAGGFMNLDDDDIFEAEDWAIGGAIWQLVDYLTRGLPELVGDVVAESDLRRVRRAGLRSIERTGSTREAVAASTRFRAAVGLGGETLIDALLEAQSAAMVFDSYVWVAANDATAPVDFRAVKDGSMLDIEVKSTKGAHERAFQMSVAELRHAIYASAFEIWRVSNLAFDAALLSGDVRRADPRGLVAETLRWLDSSPTGVHVPGVELRPSAFEWSKSEAVSCSVGRVPSETWVYDMAAVG